MTFDLLKSFFHNFKTNFLTKGEALGNQIESGKMMFIYQAQLAFDLWHGILPEIDKEIIKILDV